MFVAITLALLGLVAGALKIANGVRAYVGGEGLWSKGQKDAVYYLARYARTGDEAAHARFRSAIAVPLGDRAARLELESPAYDYAVVEAGFIAGGNDPDDIPDMVFLFRHFLDVHYFGTAVALWREADGHILRLVTIADELHAGDLDPEHRARLQDEIERLNAALTPLEHRFSSTLGEGARWIRGMLLRALLAGAALLLAGGLLVSGALARSLRGAILRLREGALRVAAGDFEREIAAESGDELGDLARVFNAMMAKRREAEEALKGATEFRDKVMQSATNSVHALDLEGRFTLVNRRTCEITGYAPEELIGHSYLRLIPESRRDEVARQFASVARDGNMVSTFETPLVRKDGREVTITFSSAPLRKDGVIVGVAGTAEDITERRRAERELALRAQELARSNAELEQFAYIASHDLQEPLRTVASYAQLLVRRFPEQAGPEAAEYSGYITDAIRRMRTMIEGLLALSRMSRGEDERRVAGLGELVDSARANLREAIAAAGGSVDRGELPALAVNPAQMVQLFQNLIGNALKFRGTEPPRVEVSAARRDGTWVVTVRDNGIGIDPRYADRIFGLYQRLHSPEKFPGHGIGLAICKKIVEQHGGRIWVEPEQPGSAFRFTLPASPAAGLPATPPGQAPRAMPRR